MSDTQKNSVEIDNDLDLVFPVSIQIQDFCKLIGMSDLGAFQVQTAVTEAINNCIIHAYKLHNEKHKVQISWLSENGILKILVSDQGTTMKSMPPDIEPPVDAEGGRGWWIMRRWMDLVEYETVRGTNTLTLSRKIDS